MNNERSQPAQFVIGVLVFVAALSAAALLSVDDVEGVKPCVEVRR